MATAKINPIFFFKNLMGIVMYSFTGFQNSGMCRSICFYRFPKSGKASEHLLLWFPEIKVGIGAFAFIDSKNQGRHRSICFYGFPKSR
jgi:hypothetical protein